MSEETEHDWEDCDEEPFCPTCAGEGFAEYLECPSAWGEDCPSLANHLIECPNCGGSGLMKDAQWI